METNAQLFAICLYQGAVDAIDSEFPFYKPMIQAVFEGHNFIAWKAEHLLGENNG